MLKAKIAVFVSGGGTNLQALLETEARGEISHGEISLVVSNKEDAYALTRAKQFGKKAVCINKKELGQALFEEQLLKTLAEEQIDFIILAGFLVILSEKFTKQYKDRIINIHPSLIPAFCGQGYYGLTVHEKALERGVKITGATVHYVNEIPDGGAIILQKAVAVKEGDTPEQLQRRVMEEAEWIILPKAAELVAEKIMREKVGTK